MPAFMATRTLREATPFARDSHPGFMMKLGVCAPLARSCAIFRGGDPATRSRAATLLRLLPPRKAWVRLAHAEQAWPEPHSGGATGGVCKERGRIHRAMVTRGY